MAWLTTDPVPFVLPEHRDLKGEPDVVAEANRRRAAERVTWKIRPLTVRQWAAVQDAAHAVGTDGRTEERLGSVRYLLLHHGLVGWEGPTGTPACELDRDGCVVDAALSRVPANWRLELADAVDRLCAFGPDAVKA